MDLSRVRACDYHPSFSTMLIDHWRRFDEEAIARDLKRAKSFMPDINAVRVTHSYDAYLRDQDAYLNHFEQILDICDRLGLGVISCLFNRWHDKTLDCGGIYLENLIPGISWAFKEGFYMPYLKDVCARHANDERVIIWETCDKPFGAYKDFSTDALDSFMYEKRWLREIYCYVKQTKTQSPVGISVRDWFGERELNEIARCADVFLRSPYYMNPELTRALFKRQFPDAKNTIIDIGGTV